MAVGAIFERHVSRRFLGSKFFWRIKMKRDLRFILISMLLIGLMSAMTVAQETTGSLEITVKDEAGALVPSVTLTVESAGTTGFKRTVTTDDLGFVRLLQVPPGNYTVTAAATAGFVERKFDKVGVNLGRTTPLEVVMSATAAEVVDVTEAGLVSPIDPTSNKIETVINADTAELLPKGNNFDSVLKVSPSTRVEPRSGQFQIDGASGSENTFIVDGLEVTNVITGTLDANSNLPFGIVQEVQVKSSGFEAEYGGATGGVINVVTKGGGNQFRGEFGAGFRTSALEPVGPNILTNTIPGGLQYYPSSRDHYSEFNPKFNLGGPIWKNKVFFFANYSPQILNRERSLTYVIAPTTPENYEFRQVREYVFGRLDAQPFEKLHLTSSYTYSPVTQEGGTPGFTTIFSTALPSQPGNPALNGADYINQTGGRQNAQSITGQGVYQATSNLLFSGRLGHYFLNEKLGSYGGGDITVARVACSAASIPANQIPASFGCPGNGVGAVSNVLFDATSRDVYEADATYSFTGLGGRHQFKGGYQYNGIANQVDLGTNDSITIRYGRPVSQFQQGIVSSPGALGAGNLQTFRTRGDVSSKSHGIYIQDKWQPTNRLALNLGIRTEEEDVPSFAPGLPGIKYPFDKKFAPRIGAAYDITGDGKNVIKGFYGWFYDRFKYELPRGSFGGDEFHNLFFEIFAGDTVFNITRDVVFGGGAPIPGGACPVVPGVFQPPVFGRVRCDKDNRVSSNSGGPLTRDGGVDQDMEPFRQSELTFSYERSMWKNYIFSARYTHKQVDAVVEDAGFPNESQSEYYIIGNPGRGLHKEQCDFFGTLCPDPERVYDALEIRFDRQFADNYFFNLNYTYSRLYGNYGGLASSDEDGRLSPNVNRYFDQPAAGYTVAGGPDNGLLPTDRPHVFKFFGAYRFEWDRIGVSSAHTTDVNVFTTLQSGTVVTSFVNINGIEQIILTRRGDQGRTEAFSQTDLAVRHRIRFGNDNRYSIVAEADILNLFNEFNIINLGRNPSGQGGNIINTQNFNVTTPAYNLITPEQRTACQATASVNQCLLVTGYRAFQERGSPEILAAATGANGANPFYNLPSAWQSKRIIRFGFRFLF